MSALDQGTDIGDWQAGTFLVAKAMPPKEEVCGWRKGGLGFRYEEVCAKGECEPLGVWTLTHIDSGYGVVSLACDLSTAIRHMNAVAALTDWTFHGWTGWRKTAPDLHDRLKAYLHEHGEWDGRTFHPDAKELPQ